MQDNNARPDRVGLIAGYGQFPGLFCQRAKEQGIRVFAVAYEGQAEKGIDDLADVTQWLYLGELSRVIEFFQSNRIGHVVFLGGIEKTQMFEDIRLDEAALTLIASITSTRDDAIMRGFAGALEEQGIQVMPSTWLLPDLLASEGVWTAREPNEQETEDMAFGFPLAKKVGELDIGQSLVVAKRSVIAVEGIDGTDATILRGGELANGEAVVIKVKKPGQDDRFDLPAVGADTIKTMIRAKATALAVDAGQAVVFDRGEMIRLANENNITIVGIKGD